MLGSNYQLPVESFRLLFESCKQYGVDLKEMLEYRDAKRCNCLSLAVSGQLSVDSFRVLVAYFPSYELFCRTRDAKDLNGERAIDYSRSTMTEAIKELLKNPDCWSKCRTAIKFEEVL